MTIGWSDCVVMTRRTARMENGELIFSSDVEIKKLVAYESIPKCELGREAVHEEVGRA